MAVLVAHVDRWWCSIERSRAASVLRRPVLESYALPKGVGRIAQWLSIPRDRQTWRDALWMLLLDPQ